MEERAQYLHLKDKGARPFLYLMYMYVCTIRICSFAKTNQQKKQTNKRKEMQELNYFRLIWMFPSIKRVL